MRVRPVHMLIAALLLGIVALPLSCLWSFGVSDPRNVSPAPFEAAAWQRADPIGNHRTVRSQMVGDLIRSKRLNGLSRVEVERMLGPPVADLRGAGVDGSRWHMAYCLGMEPAGAFSLDDEFLAIRFGDDGRVVEYRTVVN